MELMHIQVSGIVHFDLQQNCQNLQQKHIKTKLQNHAKHEESHQST